MDEKLYVAKDYQANEKILNFNNEFKNYFSLSLFYTVPFITTSIFSILVYPKAVYLVKRIFKFKSFYSINSAALLALLFLNVRVFAITQTYIGFNLIKQQYRSIEKSNNSNNDNFGSYYYKLANKINV